MPEKNKTYRARIEGYTSEGLGVARIDGQAVFVHRALRGEDCDILLLKVLKNAAFGKAVRVYEPSPHRVEPDCPYYGRCGGCDFRHMDRAEELAHKLNEIIEVADRCTILRKGKYIGTVNISETSKEELSRMMVGRNVSFSVNKKPSKPGDTVLKVEHMTVPSKVHGNNAVKDVSFNVRKGEIVCIAGIDGNGQSEFVQGLTGLEKVSGGKILFNGQDITKASIRDRSKMGMSHIPEDRHKHGLVLDYSIEQNMVLQRYWQPEFESFGFIKSKAVREYAERLIEQYDVRSGQGPVTITRSMSGGNQQKAIIAREIDKDPDLLVAVQPTRGLDVGAIEYIHSQLVAQRDKGKAVLLVSLELDEVMDVSDRILVMYEGELVGQLDPKTVSVEELGLYMAGAKRDPVPEEV